MTVLAASILDRAGETIGEALPRLAAAVLLVVIGIPVAMLVARFVRRLLLAANVDDLGERLGVHNGLSRLGLERSLSGVVGRGVRIALIVVIVVAAISLLGFGALAATLNEVVLFVPKLLVAVALVIAGVVVGDFLRRRVDQLTGQMAVGAPFGQMTEAVVVALFALTALALLGVPTTILLALVALVIAAGVLSVALAFGLGGREVAREVSAGRSIAGVFRVGERITVGGVTGEITALESVSTVLRDDGGTSVRIPNHLLVEAVVRVHRAPPGTAEQP
ncbi:MAG TPA: mechanosensitive ion channel domain-containing protein [Gaiellaceae bacterium]|nr:mechanosensitive ion channel domain-containing protein [Gaiellaceae bacterium]